MFEELQSLKEKINNAHTEWVDLKANGVLNEKAMAEIEKIDWPSFPEFSLEDYCENYSDFAVHCYIEYGMVSISAIIYGNSVDDLNDPDNGFTFDLYDLHELSGSDDLLVGVLKAKSLEDAKNKVEAWIKESFQETISIDRFDDIYSRYFVGDRKHGKMCLDEDSDNSRTPFIAFPSASLYLDTLSQAVHRYGIPNQTDMTIEEMSELTKALLKYRRVERKSTDTKKELSNIYEEMADVIIMLTQLLIMYGGNDEIQDEIDRKVKRLAERLAKHKED